MRQIVEWLLAASPVIAALILVLLAVNEGRKLKRRTFERYLNVENVRRAFGMTPIPWRGSFTKYSDDLCEAERHKRSKQ